MRDPKWRFLTHMTERANSAPPNLSSGMINAIVDEVEAAILSERRGDLKRAYEELNLVFRGLLANASEETRNALRNDPTASGPTVTAFTLGQLNFAQALIGRIDERRADDGFVDLLTHPLYEKVVRALAETPMNNADLAKRLGQTEATIWRKLDPLRAAGVTGTRKEGVRVLNFLTPPALAAFEGLHIAALPPVEGQNAGSTALQAARAKLRPVMQRVPSFGQRETVAA
jgi:hypothetical protein